MNKLRFNLMVDKKIEIDEEVNYIFKDNIYKFSINGELYKFDIENNTLLKENNESSILIDFINKIIKIIVLGINKEFFLEIEDIVIERNKNIYKLSYVLNNDGITINKIIIEII